jgi:hypothetical protein
MVEVAEDLRGREEGVPDPELVDLPGAAWRSRMLEGCWRVNAGHADYRAIAQQSQLKLPSPTGG